ncbi:amidase family protein [Paenibacillus sedimenti]|uniref:Amidase n=1 Tax=Paenibacillus sedimenti TaxID=2770274 RepID=A0A926KTV5_9BACL|nr:amidase family protein [Paenibacillus sedimenti]MBD0384034.1 amidase [Paenibacillus sedimenti]
MSINLQDWIDEADITSMQKAMATGECTSEALVSEYIERIHRYNPLINAVLEINPDALEIARILDHERNTTGCRGPLHGIPILLKDNIDTHDRMHTSAGSIALAESYAAADSFVAARLRTAGAVLLGKTNMTEWSNFMSNRMPAGYSSRGGYVLNPYGPGKLFVNGSSSGSAAAVAANLAAAAIGTETAGSIVGPASQHFLVGIKPTVGLASRSGIIPISISQDTPGPIARTVTDAAILLGAITGVDENDKATWASQNRAFNDYTTYLDAGFLHQSRIGIPRHYYQVLDEERRSIMEAVIAVLREQGATVIDPVDLHLEQHPWNNDVITYEFKTGLNLYLSQLNADVPVHSLQELIVYNQRHAASALKYGQDNLIRSEQNMLDEETYQLKRQAYNHLALTQGIDSALDQHGLDALMLPGDIDGMYIAARLGYPLITVPAGYSANGTIDADGDSTQGPFGVVFSGRAYSEPTLIRIAYSFEQATLQRRPPGLFR